MFENLGRLFKRMVKTEPKELDVSSRDSKETAKERLHMVLMQDRANVSADFLELMKEEIIDVIKKYIEVDEETIEVRLTTKTNEDGTNGTPSLYANIPILNIRNDMKVENFNFKLQSDGSIIAQKIEEPEEIKNEEIEVTIVEENNSENIIKKDEEEYNNNLDNISKKEMEPEKLKEENLLKVEERQKNLINEIIPKIEDLEKKENEDIKENTFNDSKTEIIEKKEKTQEEEDITKEVVTESDDIKQEIKTEIIDIKEEMEMINSKEENDIEGSKDSDEITVENVQLLKKSAKRGRPKKKDKKNASKANKKATKNTYSSDDDDDDDVTFDDLLKAAEEEDRRLAEQEKKEVK